jgi:hypothetical protein
MLHGICTGIERKLKASERIVVLDKKSKIKVKSLIKKHYRSHSNSKKVTKNNHS